jgi:alkylhydroperoxidase family enzyme
MEAQPFIPYVEEKDYPARLRPLLDPYVARMGFLPNALKLYMHRPEIAATLWRLNSNVMRDPPSTLEQGLKRRLGAVASKVNGCNYCTTHHCAILKAPVGIGSEGWGMTDEELASLMRGEVEPGNEMERVCFDFVRAASADPRAVPDDVHDRLNQHVTPPQIVELACVVGFWKMYNTIHDALRVPLEEHLVGQALSPARNAAAGESACPTKKWARPQPTIGSARTVYSCRSALPSTGSSSSNLNRSAGFSPPLVEIVPLNITVPSASAPDPPV